MWAGWARLYNVAHRRTVGIVKELSARWPRWLSDRKENLRHGQGHQAYKQKQILKMVKWQPHGQRITGLMIKYPHIKKNAQQFYYSALPGSVNTHMLRVLGWLVRPLFWITTLPICVIIAVMDHNNGRGFRRNLRDIMGHSAQHHK